MGRVTGRGRARCQLAGIILGVALSTAACGSGGAPSGGTSPSAPASASPSPTAGTAQPSVLCRDAAALSASISKLTDVNVGAGTADEIRADIADVKAKLDRLISDAGGQWQAQTSALTSALGKLSASVSNLAATPGATTAAAVVTALGDVTTAAQNLLAAVNTSCPSVSPSPG